MITIRFITLLLAGSAFGLTVTVQPGDQINDILSTLSSGDSLYLSPGTYVSSSEEPLLDAGPAQSGVTILSDPQNRAILNGESVERPVISLSGPHSSPVVVENLVITGGNATGSLYFKGGGILCSEASALISNCLVTGNSALIGGGLGVEGGSVTLQYSTLSNNQALVTGGGVDAYASGFNGFMLQFYQNSSSDDGGGLNSYQSTINLSSSYFTENYSGDDGGAITILQGIANLEYITMHENEAFDDGGGIRIHTIDSLSIRSSIITSNLGKAGVNVISVNKPFISNVCCWDNEFSNYHGMEDPTGTLGNISQNPLFADTELNLSQTAAGQSSNSPAIDAGHQSSWESSVAGFSTRTDSLQDQGTADMGAHHLNNEQTGIDSNLQQTEVEISITPSPAHSFLNLTVSGVTGSGINLQFYDLTGRRLHSVFLPISQESLSSCELNCADLFPEGVFFARAVWEKGSVTERFVVLQ